MTTEKSGSGVDQESSTASSRATADWPQRLAVYLFDIYGYEMLSREQQRICEDAADWALARLQSIEEASDKLREENRELRRRSNLPSLIQEKEIERLRQLEHPINRDLRAEQASQNIAKKVGRAKLIDAVESASYKLCRTSMRPSTVEVQNAALNRQAAARAALIQFIEQREKEIERLERFQTYVCQVIAMGNQADLTVESLPK